MNSIGKLALGVATLGMLVFSFCPLARAQAAQHQGQGEGRATPTSPQMGMNPISMYRCRRSSLRE